jgi:hypothetical protein
VNRTASALQFSAIDDLHLGPHWGAILTRICSSLSRTPTHVATQNQSTAQNDLGAKGKQRAPSCKPSQATPFMSTPTDFIDPSYDHADNCNPVTNQSSLEPDLQLNYEDFSWADPMSGMDISQMPWNGDQALFDILASGLPENS